MIGPRGRLTSVFWASVFWAGVFWVTVFSGRSAPHPWDPSPLADLRQRRPVNSLRLLHLPCPKPRRATLGRFRVGEWRIVCRVRLPSPYRGRPRGHPGQLTCDGKGDRSAGSLQAKLQLAALADPLIGALLVDTGTVAPARRPPRGWTSGTLRTLSPCLVKENGHAARAHRPRRGPLR
jgi:hypothetical protein